MPARNKQMAKKGRQTQALKKSKQKKMLITIGVCVSVVVIVAVALLVLNSTSQSQDRVFTDGHQTITLRDDETFTAELAHETIIGQYTQSTANSVVTVTFTSGGKSVTSRITNDILTIPQEWQDDHGHGTQLKLK